MDLQRLPTNPDALKALASSLLGELQAQDEALRQRDQRIAEHQRAIAEQEQLLNARDRELAARLQELEQATALTEKLKFELARFQRWRFGKKSEAIGAEQIALWEAELDADIEALQVRLDDLHRLCRTRANRPRGQAHFRCRPAGCLDARDHDDHLRN